MTPGRDGSDDDDGDGSDDDGPFGFMPPLGSSSSSSGLSEKEDDQHGTYSMRVLALLCDFPLVRMLVSSTACYGGAWNVARAAQVRLVCPARYTGMHVNGQGRACIPNGSCHVVRLQASSTCSCVHESTALAAMPPRSPKLNHHQATEAISAWMMCARSCRGWPWATPGLQASAAASMYAPALSARMHMSAAQCRDLYLLHCACFQPLATVYHIPGIPGQQHRPAHACVRIIGTSCLPAGQRQRRIFIHTGLVRGHKTFMLRRVVQQLQRTVPQLQRTARDVKDKLDATCDRFTDKVGATCDRLNDSAAVHTSIVVESGAAFQASAATSIKHAVERMQQAAGSAVAEAVQKGLDGANGQLTSHVKSAILLFSNRLSRTVDECMGSWDGSMNTTLTKLLEKMREASQSAFTAELGKVSSSVDKQLNEAMATATAMLADMEQVTRLCCLLCP